MEITKEQPSLSSKENEAEENSIHKQHTSTPDTSTRHTSTPDTSTRHTPVPRLESTLSRQLHCYRNTEYGFFVHAADCEDTPEDTVGTPSSVAEYVRKVRSGCVKSVDTENTESQVPISFANTQTYLPQPGGCVSSVDTKNTESQVPISFANPQSSLPQPGVSSTEPAVPISTSTEVTFPVCTSTCTSFPVYTVSTESSSSTSSTPSSPRPQQHNHSLGLGRLRANQTHGTGFFTKPSGSLIEKYYTENQSRYRDKDCEAIANCSYAKVRVQLQPKYQPKGNHNSEALTSKTKHKVDLCPSVHSVAETKTKHPITNIPKQLCSVNFQKSHSDENIKTRLLRKTFLQNQHSSQTAKKDCDSVDSSCAFNCNYSSSSLASTKTCDSYHTAFGSVDLDLSQGSEPDLCSKRVKHSGFSEVRSLDSCDSFHSAFTYLAIPRDTEFTCPTCFNLNIECVHSRDTVRANTHFDRSESYLRAVKNETHPLDSLSGSGSKPACEDVSSGSNNVDESRSRSRTSAAKSLLRRVTHSPLLSRVKSRFKTHESDESDGEKNDGLKHISKSQESKAHCEDSNQSRALIHSVQQSTYKDCSNCIDRAEYYEAAVNHVQITSNPLEHSSTTLIDKNANVCVIENAKQSVSHTLLTCTNKSPLVDGHVITADKSASTPHTKSPSLYVDTNRALDSVDCALSAQEIVINQPIFGDAIGGQRSRAEKLSEERSIEQHSLSRLAANQCAFDTSCKSRLASETNRTYCACETPPDTHPSCVDGVGSQGKQQDRLTETTALVTADGRLQHKALKRFALRRFSLSKSLSRSSSSKSVDSCNDYSTNDLEKGPSVYGAINGLQHTDVAPQVIQNCNDARDATRKVNKNSQSALRSCIGSTSRALASVDIRDDVKELDGALKSGKDNSCDITGDILLNQNSLPHDITTDNLCRCDCLATLNRARELFDFRSRSSAPVTKRDYSSLVLNPVQIETSAFHPQFHQVKTATKESISDTYLASCVKAKDTPTGNKSPSVHESNDNYCRLTAEKKRLTFKKAKDRFHRFFVKASRLSDENSQGSSQTQQSQSSSKKSSQGFDHSQQNYELQHDNGKWVDLQGSLTAFYDQAQEQESEEELLALIETEQVLASMDAQTETRPAPPPEATTAHHPLRKRSSSGEISRRESVHKWLQSISDSRDGADMETEERGVTDVSQPDRIKKPDQNANFEDDLFLGAEAKLLSTGTLTSEEEQEANKENIDTSRPVDAKPAPEPITTKAPVRDPRAELISQAAKRTSLSGPLQAWQLRRLQLMKGDSLQSTDSHKSYTSVEEILRDRNGDPETILTNLGFGSLDSSNAVKAKRIPRRFLSEPSKARGISLDDFMKGNPDIEKTYLESQDSFSFPFGSIGGVGDGGGVAKATGSLATEDTVHAPSPIKSNIPIAPRRNSFQNAARNIILFNRFSNVTSSGNPSESPQANVHEGVTPEGQSYTSILHPDNSHYFASQGLYDYDKHQPAESNPKPKLTCKVDKLGICIEPVANTNQLFGSSNLLSVNDSRSTSGKPRLRDLILASPIPEDWSVPSKSADELIPTVTNTQTDSQDADSSLPFYKTKTSIKQSMFPNTQDSSRRSSSSPLQPDRSTSVNYMTWDTLSSKDASNPVFDSTFLSPDMPGEILNTGHVLNEELVASSKISQTMSGASVDTGRVCDTLPPSANGAPHTSEQSVLTERMTQPSGNVIDLDPDSFILVCSNGGGGDQSLAQRLGISPILGASGEPGTEREMFESTPYPSDLPVDNQPAVIMADFNSHHHHHNGENSAFHSLHGGENVDLNAIEQDADFMDVLPQKSLFGRLLSTGAIETKLSYFDSDSHDDPSVNVDPGSVENGSETENKTETSPSILKGKPPKHPALSKKTKSTSDVFETKTDPKPTSSFTQKRRLPLSLPKFSILDDNIDLLSNSGSISSSSEQSSVEMPPKQAKVEEKRSGPVIRKREGLKVRPLGHIDKIDSGPTRSRSTDNLTMWEDKDEQPASHSRRRQRMRKGSWHNSSNFQDSFEVSTSDYDSPFTHQPHPRIPGGGFGSGFNHYKSVENLRMFEDPGDSESYIDRLQRLKQEHEMKYHSQLDQLDAYASRNRSEHRPDSPLSYQDGYSPSSSEADGYLSKLRKMKEEHEQSKALASRAYSSDLFNKMEEIKAQHEQARSEQLGRIGSDVYDSISLQSNHEDQEPALNGIDHGDDHTALPVSDNREYTLGDNIETTRYNVMSQQKGKEVMQSFEMEEIESADADIVGDDLPNIKQNKGPLLRTGSTQSDSSGFADSTDSTSHCLSEHNWHGLKLAHRESLENADTYSRQDSESSMCTLTEPQQQDRQHTPPVKPPRLSPPAHPTSMEDTADNSLLEHSQHSQHSLSDTDLCNEGKGNMESGDEATHAHAPESRDGEVTEGAMLVVDNLVNTSESGNSHVNLVSDINMHIDDNANESRVGDPMNIEVVYSEANNNETDKSSVCYDDDSVAIARVHSDHHGDRDNDDGFHGDHVDEGIDLATNEMLAETGEILMQNEEIRLVEVDEHNDESPEAVHHGPKYDSELGDFSDATRYPVPEFPKVRLAERRKDILKRSKSPEIKHSDQSDIDNASKGDNESDIEANWAHNYVAAKETPETLSPRDNETFADNQAEEIIDQFKGLEEFDDLYKPKPRKPRDPMYDIRESSLECEEPVTKEAYAREDNILEHPQEELAENKSGQIQDHLGSGELHSESESESGEEIKEEEVVATVTEDREDERMRKELTWMASVNDGNSGDESETKPSLAETIKEKIKSTFGGSKSKKAKREPKADENEGVVKGLHDSADVVFKATLAPFRRVYKSDDLDSPEDLELPASANKEDDIRRKPKSQKLENPNRKSFAEEMNDIARSSNSSNGEVFDSENNLNIPHSGNEMHHSFENPIYEEGPLLSSSRNGNYAQGISYHESLPGDLEPNGQGQFDDLIEAFNVEGASLADLSQFRLDPLEMEVEARRRSTLIHTGDRAKAGDQVGLMGDNSKNEDSLLESQRSSSKSFEEKCVGTDDEIDAFSQTSSGPAFSKRIIVSKFTTERPKSEIKLNQVSEVTLFIDNGEIKEIRNADALNETGGVVEGRYESYEVQPDQFTPQDVFFADEHGQYSVPAYPGHYPYPHDPYASFRHRYPDSASDRRRYQMYRDSGYNTAFTSISDPFSGRCKSVSNLDLTCAHTQDGISFSRSLGPQYGAHSKSLDDLGGGAHDLDMGRGSGGEEMNWSMMSGCSDVSEHQLLCTMLKQSEYYGPQLDGILQKSQWPLFARTRALTKQNLVEEVKLMQHALQKYKMEFKALEIRSRGSYRTHVELMSTEEREALESMEEIRTEIGNEITHMEKALANRMRRIIAGSAPATQEVTNMDLAGLNVIAQMIEVLKEQVYHSNTVTSLIEPDRVPAHPLLAELESTSEEHEQNMSGLNRSNSLLDHLGLLQQQMSAQQSHTTAVLNNSLRELKTVLLDEIRNSIHTETQQLKYKVQDTESQLSELRRQISSPGLSDRPTNLLLSDTDLDQSTET